MCQLYSLSSSNIRITVALLAVLLSSAPSVICRISKTAMNPSSSSSIRSSTIGNVGRSIIPGRAPLRMVKVCDLWSKSESVQQTVIVAKRWSNVQTLGSKYSCVSVCIFLSLVVSMVNWENGPQVRGSFQGTYGYTIISTYVHPYYAHMHVR